MRAHCLQHVSFEDPGALREWFSERGFDWSFTRFFADDSLPEVEAIDFLIVMGGPMSVNETALYPWLLAEKAFVRAAIEAGKPVLGICLGAQIIASALGAAVYPCREKEIGWFPIYSSDEFPLKTEQNQPCFRFPSKTTALHWHGETFDLPNGAVRLASSDACQNQAFQLIDRPVVGLQFHLEVTPKLVGALVSECRSELVGAPYIQSETEILNADAAQYQVANQLMARILEHLLTVSVD